MNRLHAIDVFEEVKDGCSTGQEFCLKLYQSHVTIQPRPQKLTMSDDKENVGLERRHGVPHHLDRFHARDIKLQIVNEQQFILRVIPRQNIDSFGVREQCFFKLKVMSDNDRVRRKRWKTWRTACIRSTMGIDDFIHVEKIPNSCKSKSGQEVRRWSFSPSEDPRIRQVLQPLYDAWGKTVQHH